MDLKRLLCKVEKAQVMSRVLLNTYKCPRDLKGVFKQKRKKPKYVLYEMQQKYIGSIKNTQELRGALRKYNQMQ